MNYSRGLFFLTVLDLINQKFISLQTHKTKASIVDTAKRYMEIFKDIEVKFNTKSRIGFFISVSEKEKDFIAYCNSLYKLLGKFVDETAKARELSKFLAALIEDIERLKLEVQNNIKTKPCVVFLAQDSSIWPSLESVWEAFANDSRCQVRLIQVPFNHANLDKGTEFLPYYLERGYPVISADNYDMSQDNPDIVFFAKPYDSVPKEYYIDSVCKVVNRTVYIPYGFEVAKLVDYQFRQPLQFKAWRVIAHSEANKKMFAKYGYNNGKNVVAMGHPSFDKIIKFLKEKPKIYPEWESKTRNRKVILWNSHFTIQQDTGWGTYLLWRELIFKLIFENQDLVLLWRPHPLFFGSLKKNNIMNDLEIDEFKESIKHSDNIILDESGDYRYSMYASDALISDGTSFLLEYLATKKPILYTPKPDGWGILDDHLVEHYYIANNEEDIIKFFKMMIKGEDPLYEKRMETLGEYLMNLDGRIGEKIKDYLLSELEKEERKSAVYLVNSAFD